MTKNDQDKFLDLNALRARASQGDPKAALEILGRAPDVEPMADDEYGPECIKVLEGLEPVRKRPEGFIAGE